jgi:protocatechuate 3,4-dioxygenase beta subunit
MPATIEEAPMSSEEGSAVRLRRRDAIVVGGLALGGALASRTAAAGSLLPSEGAAECVLTPELTEGPYWIDNSLTRRDITEGRHGLPLILRLAVVHADNCRPIKGADVELWHADASGEYSGFEGGPGGRTETRYLRGHQRTNAKGVVRFDTIFPGWYAGRTPHIHVKVHVGGDEVHTGQLFFNERITRAVYRTRYYASRGEYDTSHSEDNIYAQGGARSTPRLRRRAHGRKGYVGTLTMGVNA